MSTAFCSQALHQGPAGGQLGEVVRLWFGGLGFGFPFFRLAGHSSSARRRGSGFSVWWLEGLDQLFVCARSQGPQWIQAVSNVFSALYFFVYLWKLLRVSGLLLLGGLGFLSFLADLVGHISPFMFLSIVCPVQGIRHLLPRVSTSS